MAASLQWVTMPATHLHTSVLKMQGKLVSFLLLASILGPWETTAAAANLKASDFFKICKRNDPGLNNCIKETLEDLKPKLRKGISQLKIPSVEPMIVPRMSITQGSGPVSIDSTFTDLHIEGITNFDVKDIRADLDNYKIVIKIALPYLYVHGDYNINGKILVLPITGSGDSWSNYTDVTGIATLSGHKEVQNGKDYMKLDALDFNMEVKRAVIHMNNLFNGNKELGDAMNKFMSENWEVVFSELKPVVNEAVSVLLKNVAEKVFITFPFDELFPSK